MLSSRNIHLAILGIILGATSGYVFAFYQIDKKIPATAPAAASSAGAGPGQNHPEVSNDQVLAMFKSELEKNPDNVELLSRYGDFLSDIQSFDDAIAVYQKVLKLDPKNLDVQTYMGTAMWNLGRKDEAVAAYQKSLAADPNHLPTLYYMALVDLSSKHDIAAATEKLQKMEKIDPKHPALDELRKRIEAEKNKTK